MFILLVRHVVEAVFHCCYIFHEPQTWKILVFFRRKGTSGLGGCILITVAYLYARMSRWKLGSKVRISGLFHPNIPHL